MMFTSKLQELKQKKKEINEGLDQLNTKYHSGELTRQEFVDKQYDLLGGKFKEDIISDIDKEIRSLEKKKTTFHVTSAALIIILALISMFNPTLTGFATLQEQDTATLQIDKTYEQDTVENYTFLNTTQLRVNGKIYGYGETWIYLESPNQTRLIYYADTRNQQQLTGLATGIPVNITNTTQQRNNTQPHNTTKQASNETNTTQANTTTNQPSNQTNNTTNQTNNTQPHNTTNQTTNDTNVTHNETEQDTVKTGFNASITTDKDTYQIGENVSINITPTNASITVYMHTPSDTYILQENYWTIQEEGNHTVSALITKDNKTERVSKTFQVQTPMQTVTQTITESCVETCTMTETPIKIRIVLKDTRLELNNLSYTPAGTTSESNTTNTTKQNNEEQQKTQTKPNQPFGPCEHPNPNKREVSCLYENATDNFPEQKILIENHDRKPVARITPIGNLLIGGGVYEQSTENPGPRDFRIGYVDRDGNSIGTIWIDTQTGDLHLKGNLYEENTNLNPPRGSYSLKNKRNIYMIYADEEEGNLYVRGNVIPYRYGGER